MHTDIGIYIHVPFCAKKCPYCDFYSENFNMTKSKEYVNAVIRNIEYFGDKNLNVNTIYFGGGTPSILQSEQIGSIIKSVRDNFNFLDNNEITIECNPDTINQNRLKIWKDSGVNRISIGVESLLKNELELLGRRYLPEKSLNAIQMALSFGFENISCDVMIGLPNQSFDDLKITLDGLTSYDIKHISVYMLQIESGTKFDNDDFIKRLPNDDVTADLYLKMSDYLWSKNFHHYEISNFAKDGFESCHNNKYWNCEEYIGIGPSAHSFLNGKRFACGDNLEKFIKNKFQSVTVTEETGGTIDEKVMLGLRLAKGIDAKYINLNNAAVKSLEKADYIKIKNGRLSLTTKGFLVSNAVILKVTDALNREEFS